jgi:hypothetical protein
MLQNTVYRHRYLSGKGSMIMIANDAEILIESYTHIYGVHRPTQTLDGKDLTFTF